MKLLDIYYNIDLDNNQDHTYIERCLQIYIKAKHQEYKIHKFEKYTSDIYNKQDKDKKNIIRNGLNIFNEMFNDLKLKNGHDVWFFYISNGDIDNKYKDISVVLLNKIPMCKKVNYAISKKIFDININYKKEEKLKQTKCLTNSLNHLFNNNNNNIIEYI
jgi:hypothetical protein